MPAFGVPFSDLPQEAQAMAYELSRRSDSELVATARGNEGAMAASRQWLEDAHFRVRDDGELRSLASHAERLRRNRLDPIPVELFDYFGYSEPYDEQDLYSNHNLANRKDAMTTNSKSGRRPNRSASRKRAYSAADREIERYYHEVLENPYSEDAKWLSDPAFDAELSAREIVDEGILQDFTEDSFDYLVQTLQYASDLYKEEHEASYRPRSASRKKALDWTDGNPVSEDDFEEWVENLSARDKVLADESFIRDELESFKADFDYNLTDSFNDDDAVQIGLDVCEEFRSAYPGDVELYKNGSRSASRRNRNRKATMTTARQTVAARKARAAALRLAADKLDPIFDRSASRRPARSAGRKRAYTVQELADEKNLDLATVLDYLGYPASTPADEVVPDTGAEEFIREARRRESAHQARIARRTALRLAARRRRAADDDAEDDFDWEEKAEEREEDEAEKEARIARRTAAIVLRSLRRQASVTRRAADVGQEDTPEDLPEVDENEQPTEADDDTAHGNGVVNTVPQTDESGVDEPTADEDPLEPVSVPDLDEARQASRRPVRLSGRTASTASDDTALL